MQHAFPLIFVTVVRWLLWLIFAGNLDLRETLVGAVVASARLSVEGGAPKHEFEKSYDDNTLAGCYQLADFSDQFDCTR